MTQTKTLSVELDAAIADKLDALAREARLTPALLAADILARSIEVEAEEIALIEARVAAADAGGPFVSHAEVERWARSLATDQPSPRPKGERR
jgi:predicted transcriptional regulator